MKRARWMVVALVLLAVLLGAGAFMGGRLLTTGTGVLTGSGGRKVMISSGQGDTSEADFIPADELPESEPDVAGVYAGRQDSSIFVDETVGGFIIGRNDDGSIAVLNATGRISEIVVVAETEVHVDVTLEKIDESLAEGVVRQELRPGTVEEIGEMSFVRAWGEQRGERLVASILVYSRPPVINR